MEHPCPPFTETVCASLSPATGTNQQHVLYNDSVLNHQYIPNPASQYTINSPEQVEQNLGVERIYIVNLGGF